MPNSATNIAVIPTLIFRAVLLLRAMTTAKQQTKIHTKPASMQLQTLLS
jgi:hypothetical protein